MKYSKYKKENYIKSDFVLDTEKMRFNELEGLSFFTSTSVIKSSINKFISPCSFNSTLFSKELYEKVGGYSSINPTGPDAHLVFKALLNGCVYAFYDKVLFSYRVHNSNQTSQSQNNRNINFLIDGYLTINAYSSELLTKSNILRIEIVKAFIEHRCIRGGLRELKEGNWQFALRHCFFSLAADIKYSLLNIKFFIFVALLIIGPIGILILKITHKLKKS